MKPTQHETMEGNYAAAYVAYAFSEVAAIYPITPSSLMGEFADEWASKKKLNMFGQVVDVVEMQSEGGAAGAVHGSLSAGALTSTFTASQGLMLMLPNMHKIAGELLPTVFYVSARSLACQSLSIFGDHSDVMSARNTGWAMLAANSVQEVMDLAVISNLATLESHVPFLFFFDGFRTSNEVQKFSTIDYETMKEMLDMRLIEEFRSRAMNPEHPQSKVGQHNPDVYFQGRERSNPYYIATPAIVEKYMAMYAEKVGRKYNLFDYVGAPDAENVIVAMGSGCETIEETVEYLNRTRGAKLGLVKVRLYRPFGVEQFRAVLPASVKKIAVLDRTKEPGAIGEPLYLDVVAALKDRCDLTIIGGRYGLSSKDFIPTHVKAVFDWLANECRHDFTVGIEDDVTNLSVPIREQINAEPERFCGKFWGLGSDGTVGANKNSIKIIGDHTEMFAQGYFQYDSKKSGGITRSHLRFGKDPIKSIYLVYDADFIGCHNQAFIDRYDVLEGIKPGGVFLLNSNWKNEEVFEHLTADMQRTLIEKKIKFYNIDALKISLDVGLGNRINTVMQTAFFLISGVLPKEEAIKMIKGAIKKQYSKKGDDIVQQNYLAVDRTNEALVEISLPATMPAKHHVPRKLVPDGCDDFTRNVIERTMREKGDDIPVSQMTIDGYVPTGTTALEKRGVAPFVPKWLPEKCIQCNRCSLVCPHAAIRPKLIDRNLLGDKPASFTTIKAQGKDGEAYEYRMQVYPEDCQYCANCVKSCPVQALELSTIQAERDAGENENQRFFSSLPEDVLGSWKESTFKGSQFKQPLLEFSGACAGCGETPYVKLITQLFGDRMIVANATGCSSIWGGTFPTIPYCKNQDGHGPAWANSLFEDNAEYGMGMRLAVDANRRQLRAAVEKLMADVQGEEFAKFVELAKQEGGPKLEAVKTIQEFGACLQYALEHWNDTDAAAKKNSARIGELLDIVLGFCVVEERKAVIKKIRELKHYFVRKSVWSFGGDGWAYDIGYGGLDHVLASGRNINVLVLDTELYSNTGGQASKATPLGSIAKFAEGGKTTIKKDLGMMMMSYGYIYVASVAMGADAMQLMKAVQEAEAYDGPSIIIAYAPCINQGVHSDKISMDRTQQEEKLAVDSGYWYLYRFNPTLAAEGKNPFTLDSKPPTVPVEEFLKMEKRYTSLGAKEPEKMKAFWAEFDRYSKARYEKYKKMAE
jgi:pyruvate-ferredoxin/flavodoxin oxidoreductase